jgi:hypothetical protein
LVQQLGHADWSVTARHYARWVGGNHYVEPARLAPGEVPADLLARFEADHSREAVRVAAHLGLHVAPSCARARGPGRHTKKLADRENKLRFGSTFE